MARRRAPQSPPLDAQRQAAGWAATGKRWTDIQVSDAEAYVTDVDLLEYWLLRDHPAAAEIAPRGRGRPPKWARMIEALRWLRANGVDTLSDAPGSRCVQELGGFIDQGRATLYRGERDSTAEELAGTLVALRHTIERDTT